MTKPSRATSNGFALPVALSALALANAANETASMHPSAPPAIITFASPRCSALNASPMQCADVAHAVAAVHEVDVEEVFARCRENTRRVYGI